MGGDLNLVLENTCWQILTPSGFEDFSGLSIKSAECIEIVYSTRTIQCTLDHQIKNSNKFTQASEFFIGQETDYGEVQSIKSIGVQEVYDPINVESHEYISNDVISHNCSMVYIDEMAFVDGWEAFSSSVLPTISSGRKTKLFFTSTPCGYNHFHKYCVEAQRGTNGFKYYEVPWWKIPGRDQAWKERTLKVLNNDEQKFAQEYACSFLGSILTLISSNKLKTLAYEIPLNPSEEDSAKIYLDEIQKDSTFVLTADVCQGRGLDYHAFSVIDITQQPYKQVAAFRNNRCSPVEYAEIIYRTAKKFNNAYVLVELNDLGTQVANTLALDFEYENIIYTVNKGRLGQVACFYQEKADPGVKTSITTKAVGCNMLKSLIEKDVLILVDADTIDELTTFVRSDKARGSFCAQEGKHDDTITPLFLFGWLTNTPLFTELTDVEMRNDLRMRAQNEIEQLASPIGIPSGGYNESSYERFDGNVWSKSDDESSSELDPFELGTW